LLIPMAQGPGCDSQTPGRLLVADTKLCCAIAVLENRLTSVMFCLAAVARTGGATLASWWRWRFGFGEGHFDVRVMV
jgi:hypothetical protein